MTFIIPVFHVVNFLPYVQCFISNIFVIFIYKYVIKNLYKTYSWSCESTTEKKEEFQVEDDDDDDSIYYLINNISHQSERYYLDLY